MGILVKSVTSCVFSKTGLFSGDVISGSCGFSIAQANMSISSPGVISKIEQSRSLANTLIAERRPFASDILLNTIALWSMDFE